MSCKNLRATYTCIRDYWSHFLRMQPLHNSGVICDRSGVMAQKLVIKNTFYEIIDADEDLQPRSQSAPPRLFGRGLASLKSVSRCVRRGAARAARQKRNREDDKTFEEFAAATRIERWTFVVGRLMSAAVRARLAAARTSLPAQSHTSTLQLELPRHLFMEMAALLFETDGDGLFLVRLGVLRVGQTNDAVGIWSAKACIKHGVMQALLGTARGLLSMANEGVFQVTGRGSRPIVLRHSPRFRLEDLRALLQVPGFGPSRLLHLRRDLVGDGLLSDCGVVPGSCVLME